MTEFWMKFRNGTVEATDFGGPPLFGGVPINLDGVMTVAYPYRRLRKLTGLSTSRVYWIRGRYIKYTIDLTMEGDMKLDLSRSSFPAPPGDQVQTYNGKVKLTSSHMEIIYQAVVTITYPSAPTPDANTLIKGTMKGNQEPPRIPFISSRVTATFDSKFPIRYGQDPAIYEVNNFELRGKFGI